MDGSFNYMQRLGEKLSAKPNAEPELTQPAYKDIEDALKIIGDPRITRVDPFDMLRVVELLNSALEKAKWLEQNICAICLCKCLPEYMHDDGVCFGCRDPEVAPGEQPTPTAVRPTPLQRGVLRTLRGYGPSTVTQILNRVLPVHDTAQEGNIHRALEVLMDVKMVEKIGARRYEITELGMAELRTR